MDIYDIYYLQTNLICVVLLAFVFISYVRDVKAAAEAFFFKAEIVEIFIYCVSDILAAVCKGETFPGARIILLLANTLYISMPLLMITTWSQYILRRLAKYGICQSRTGTILRWCVLAVFAVSLSTPLTHFTFYLDADNLYHRQFGAYIVPVFSYLYLIGDTVRLLLLSRRSDLLEVRRDAHTLMFFGIPGILCSLLQVFCYGITTAQVGFTLGFLIVYLVSSQNKISRDELTGINNRREFEVQLDHIAKTAETLLVCMLDVDYFKKINDTYGHAEGDTALQLVASTLGHACGSCKASGSFVLARYGGDEFVILARDYTDLTESLLRDAILSELEATNNSSGKPYTLVLSLGFAGGEITKPADVHAIMKRADEEMYRTKDVHHRFA